MAFIIKKPYLRLYFEMYIKSVEKLNTNISRIDMAEILEAAVLNDLKCFMKYIDGLVDIECDDKN